jgi:hypothetical protein
MKDSEIEQKRSELRENKKNKLLNTPWQRVILGIIIPVVVLVILIIVGINTTESDFEDSYFQMAGLVLVASFVYMVVNIVKLFSKIKYHKEVKENK